MRDKFYFAESISVQYFCSTNFNMMIMLWEPSIKLKQDFLQGWILEVIYFLPQDLDLDLTKKVTLTVFFALLALCMMSKVCISVDVLICLVSNSKTKQAILKNRTLYSYCYRQWNFMIKLRTESENSLFMLRLSVFLFCAHMTSSNRREMTSSQEAHLKLTLTYQTHMISFSLNYFFTSLTSIIATVRAGSSTCGL